MIKRILAFTNKNIFRNTQLSTYELKPDIRKSNQFSDFVYKLTNRKVDGLSGLLLNYNKPVYYIRYLNKRLFLTFDYIDQNMPTAKALI